MRAWDELRDAYRARVGVDAAGGPLQHTAGMAGADGPHRLQHRLPCARTAGPRGIYSVDTAKAGSIFKLEVLASP